VSLAVAEPVDHAAEVVLLLETVQRVGQGE